MTHKSCNNCVYLLRDKARDLNCCNAFHDLTDVEDIGFHSCSEWEKKEIDLLTQPRRNQDEENDFRGLRDRWRETWTYSDWMIEARREDTSFADEYMIRPQANLSRDEYMIRPQANLPRADEFPATTRNFSYFISELVARQSVDIECRFRVKPSYILMNPRTYDHYRRDLPFHRDGQTINGMPIITAPCIPDNEVEVVPSLSSRRATDPSNPSSFRGWL